MHRSLRHAWLHSHFRRGIVSRTDDKISVGIHRRNGAIGQFLRRDKSRRVRIASGGVGRSAADTRSMPAARHKQNAMLRSFLFIVSGWLHKVGAKLSKNHRWHLFPAASAVVMPAPRVGCNSPSLRSGGTAARRQFSSPNRCFQSWQYPAKRPRAMCNAEKNAMIACGSSCKTSFTAVDQQVPAIAEVQDRARQKAFLDARPDCANLGVERGFAVYERSLEPTGTAGKVLGNPPWFVINQPLGRVTEGIVAEMPAVGISSWACADRWNEECECPRRLSSRGPLYASPPRVPSSRLRSAWAALNIGRASPPFYFRQAQQST